MWLISINCLCLFSPSRCFGSQLLKSRAGRTIPGMLTVSAVACTSLSGHSLHCTGPGTPEISMLSEKNASPIPAVTPIWMPRIDDSPPTSDRLQQLLAQPGMAPSVGIVAACQIRDVLQEWSMLEENHCRAGAWRGLCKAPERVESSTMDLRM